MSFTVIGTVEIAASSTGPAASRSLRSMPVGGPAACGGGLLISSIIFCVRFNSCCAAKSDGSMNAAF